MKKKVVITGLGVISPLGNNVNKMWNNLINGVSGIDFINDFDTSNYCTKFAGIITNFNIMDYTNKKKTKKFDLFVQYGIAAGIEAIEDSNIYKIKQKDRVGIIIGSGIGGLNLIEKNCNILKKKGIRKISPMFIPGCIINMMASYLAIIFGFKGPNFGLSASCSTGSYAINVGVQTIQTGNADVIIAGGSEKASTPLGISGFSAMNALSKYNDNPKLASRPWDKTRDGFVISDGAACIVLEEYEHALKRNAKIYAEISGFSMNCDAYHITEPEINGTIKSMKIACNSANISPNKIDYINAHGTSTIKGDINESLSIKSLFNNHIKKTYVSSTKSMTGHLLGASASLEAVITTLSIKNQIAPPTINLKNIDKNCNLNHILDKSISLKINYALSNSFGFGGTNSCLILKNMK